MDKNDSIIGHLAKFIQLLIDCGLSFCLNRLYVFFCVIGEVPPTLKDSLDVFPYFILIYQRSLSLLVSVYCLFIYLFI